MSGRTVTAAAYETHEVSETERQKRTNFWLTWYPRYDHSENYQTLCDGLMRQENRDVQAVGKLMVSIPEERGRSLCRALTHLLPFEL